MVPLTGIEPVQYCYRGILSPLRLPVPPQRRMVPIVSALYYSKAARKSQPFPQNLSLSLVFAWHLLTEILFCDKLIEEFGLYFYFIPIFSILF